MMMLKPFSTMIYNHGFKHHRSISFKNSMRRINFITAVMKGFGVFKIGGLYRALARKGYGNSYKTLQRDLCAMLDGELNSRFGRRNIDVALDLDGTKIAVEYDAYYWHAGRDAHDAKRDEADERSRQADVDRARLDRRRWFRGTGHEWPPRFRTAC